MALTPVHHSVPDFRAGCAARLPVRSIADHAGNPRRQALLTPLFATTFFLAGGPVSLGAACGLPASKPPANSTAAAVPRSRQRRPPRGPPHSTQRTPSTRPAPARPAAAPPGLRPRRPAAAPPGAAGSGGAVAAGVERGGAGAAHWARGHAVAVTGFQIMGFANK